MKRLSAIAAIALLTLSLSACGTNESPVDSAASNDQSIADSVESGGETSGSAELTDSTELDAGAETDDGGDTAADGPLALLNTVWSSYGENEKFPVAGGDMSEENMTMDAPGVFGIEDTEALDATLAFPAACVGQIDAAASLVHMMNANTFTCGVFHLTNAEDAADVSAAVKENVMQRQWLCGFPDQLVIVQADDEIVVFFGEKEIISTFQEKLTAAYPSAETLCDEPIA